MLEITNQKDTFSASHTEKRFEETCKSGTILVIDDELGPRESLKMLLKDSYRVVTSDSGDAGIEYLKHHEADTVILDLKMPGKNGIETLEEIRKFDENIPVIILTGYGDMDAARKAIHLNAIEFINKPFDVQDMRNMVRKACARKEADRKTENLISELSVLNLQLKDKMAKIENMATIGQLSAEIIHDVNNLLTVIYGYTQLLLLETDKDNDANRQYIATIEEEIKKCRNITNSVVELSKIKMEVMPVNINGIVGKVVEFFRNSSISQNIKFSFAADNNIPFVNADAVQVHKALINIVLNAIQAIEKSGEISIQTSRQGNHAVISIKDSGKGICREDICNIFKPSFTTKKNGTGLGLHIADKVINRHKGRIDVKSELNKGAEFIIYLPVFTDAGKN
ncbi:MAG TPA: response regulator [bacterium]|nr:response regulator [bacterium]